MLGEDVLYLTVSELSERIRSRRLSPVELTEGYLARATAGIKTTWGARPTRNQMFDRDATVIRDLRDAGAVLLEKLGMVEFAGCLGYRYCDSSLTGPGRNPWNPDRWTGGSSSGTGAAVSTALIAFGIGTETWGSILCPSAFCGVTGLRPRYGRVSHAGGMVGSYTLHKIGPMARRAADCRLALEAIAGPDPEDPSSAAEPARLDRRPRDLRGLRGALVTFDFAKTKGAEPEVKAAFDGAVTELRTMGLPLEETKLPEFPASEVATVAPPIEKNLNETLPYPDPVGAVGNACGLPSIALPCGFGRGHLPTGFQIMGSAFDEGLRCDLGEMYQARTRFHRERPPLSA